MSHHEYVVRLADDALIAAQRLVQWCTHAPSIEEEVALANISLDLLGQARALYTHVGELAGDGRDEDSLAFLREEDEFGNVLLVETENGDFACTIAKMLYFSTYQFLLYEALSASTDSTLAGIAAKSAKETAYHMEHAAGWTVRLGDGTEESHRRMRTGVDDVWPYTCELFETDYTADAAVADGVGVDPGKLRAGWLDLVESTLNEATIPLPTSDWAPSGGRYGVHTEAFGFLLGEMQSLHRAHPGATW